MPELREGEKTSQDRVCKKLKEMSRSIRVLLSLLFVIECDGNRTIRAALS